MAKSTKTTTTPQKTKPLSKAQILEMVTDAIGDAMISRKLVKQIVETLVTVAHKELKKNGVSQRVCATAVG